MAIAVIMGRYDDVVKVVAAHGVRGRPPYFLHEREENVEDNRHHAQHRQDINKTAEPCPFWRALHDGYSRFSYTTLPPTTVHRTSASPMKSRSFSAKMSRDNTTRSASFPGSIEPRS